MYGKGDRYRPVDRAAFDANYNELYPPKPPRPKHVKCRTCFGAGVVPNPAALYGERGVKKCPNPKCDDGLVLEEVPSA